MLRLAELNVMWRTVCTNHGFTVLGADEPAANGDMLLPDQLADQVQAIADGLRQLGGNMVVTSLYLYNGEIAFPWITLTPAAGSGC